MTAIDTLRHKIKYPRPTKLSDPWDDFPAVLLERILATPDDKLAFSEFRELFGPSMPAGDYEEVMYFLPLAFAYFANPENGDDAYEMLFPLVQLGLNRPVVRHLDKSTCSIQRLYAICGCISASVY